MPERNAIGSLVVSDTATFTEYPLPTAGSEPYDLAYADGALWFTERLGNRIGRLDVTTGDIVEFPIPTANSEPTGIAVADNGDVWFCLRAGNGLARLTPDSGQIQVYTYAKSNAGLEDLALDQRNPADIHVWMTASALNKVVEFAFKSGNPVFTSVDTSSPVETFRRPLGIVVDPTGIPWVSVNESNAILRYAPGTLSLWRPYRLPTPNAGPGQLVFRPNGTIWEFWFVEINSQKVGQLRVLPTGEPLLLLDQPLPSTVGQPWGVAVDEEGHVWVTGNTGNAVAEWLPPYFKFAYLPFVFQ
jgi:virginiamycin B lyase